MRWSYEIFPARARSSSTRWNTRFRTRKAPTRFARSSQTIRKKRINTGFPIEYRTVAADDVWMSPFYGRESATIAVHQYHRVDTKRLFDTCEASSAAYAGRPHWGKRHTRTADEFATLYPKFDAFREVRRRLDPAGKFLNPHLRAMFA